MFIHYISLPREIKLEIASHLELADLKNLSLASRLESELIKDNFIWKGRKIKYE